MRRRDVIRRLGAASVAAAGATSVAAGETTESPDWNLSDGRTDRVDSAALDRQAATATTLNVQTSEPTCCQWSDNPGCRDCDYTLESA